MHANVPCPESFNTPCSQRLPTVKSERHLSDNLIPGLQDPHHRDVCHTCLESMSGPCSGTTSLRRSGYIVKCCLFSRPTLAAKQDLGAYACKRYRLLCTRAAARPGCLKVVLQRRLHDRRSTRMCARAVARCRLSVSLSLSSAHAVLRCTASSVLEDVLYHLCKIGKTCAHDRREPSPAELACLLKEVSPDPACRGICTWLA